MIPQLPAHEKPVEKPILRARPVSIGLSGEGNCAIVLVMVLICANDLWTRRAGGFLFFSPSDPVADGLSKHAWSDMLTAMGMEFSRNRQ